MKLTKRVLFAASIAVTVMLAAITTAQQKGRGRGGFGGLGGPTPPVVLAANEAVQKDLGLSSDKVSKLTSLRDDYFAAQQKEFQSAGINFQDFQNLSNEERQKRGEKMVEIGAKLNAEFGPKLKEIVSADQFKRLQQIQLQYGLRNLGPPALTAPDVAADLKITDDQKQKLNDLNAEYGRKQRELFSGGGFDQEAFAKLRDERASKALDVLTAEQKEKLNSLKGPAFDVTQITFGGRRGKN
jgi:hypothetical protein